MRRILLLLSVMNWPLLAYGGQLKYVEPEPALTLNPLAIEDQVSLRLLSIVHHKLIAQDEFYNLQPVLLESKDSVDKDEMSGVYRFRMRADLYWFAYDRGRGQVVNTEVPVTPDDVVYTYETVCHGRASQYGYLCQLFTKVKNAGHREIEFTLVPSKRGLSEDFIRRSLQFVVIPDPQKLPERFRRHNDSESEFPTPYVSIGSITPSSNAITPIVISDKETMGVDMERYKGKGWDINDPQVIHRIRMKVNPDTDRVFDHMANTEVSSDLEYHLQTEMPLHRVNETIDHPRVSAKEHSVNNFNFIMYNHKTLFGDPRLRQAFTHAIDRKDIFLNVYGDVEKYRKYSAPEIKMSEIPEIIHTPLSTNYRWLIQENVMIEYNPEKARKLRDQVVSEKSDLGQKLKGELKLLVTGTNESRHHRICTRFAEQIWQTLRIKITVLTLTSAEYHDAIRNGNFDLAFGSATFESDADIIGLLFHSDSTRNVVSYRNSKLDKLLEQYSLEQQEQVRDSINYRIAQIISADVPYTFLFRIPNHAAYRHDILGYELRVNPFSVFDYMGTWRTLE